MAHVGAALKHHVFEKDNVLRRMLPFGRVHRRPHPTSSTGDSCMKRLVPAVGLALPGAAFATDYTVQPAASTLGFSSTFQGEAFQGHFERVDGRDQLRPCRPGHLAVRCRR